MLCYISFLSWWLSIDDLCKRSNTNHLIWAINYGRPALAVAIVEDGPEELGEEQYQVGLDILGRGVVDSLEDNLEGSSLEQGSLVGVVLDMAAQDVQGMLVVQDVQEMAVQVRGVQEKAVQVQGVQGMLVLRVGVL